MTTDAAVVEKPVDAPVAPVADPAKTIADPAKPAADPGSPDTLVNKDGAVGPAKAAEVADWRKQIAEARANGDDAKAGKILKRLERFTDHGALYDSWEEAQALIRESGKIKLPGKDATEEDIKAFNKSLGVPDSADGYKIKLPDDVTLDDSDKAQIKAITEGLHKRGGMAAAPETVQIATDLFLEMREAAQAEFVAKGAQFAQDSKKALEKEWGPDFAKNIAYTGPGLVAMLGNEGDVLRQVKLADGGYLGDHPLFVKMAAQAGRIAGDDPIFWRATQMQGDGKSLEGRKSEIMALRTSSKPGDREKYADLSKPGGELSIINSRLEQLQRKPAS